MKQMTRMTTRAVVAISLCFATPLSAMAHPDWNEKRPQTYAEAFIGMTEAEAKRQPSYRHPPGNVRAEDMMELFGGKVLVIDFGRKFSTVGATRHALKVIVIGRNGRYNWCAYNNDFEYSHRNNTWAPVKVKHAGMLLHRLDPNINNDRIQGLSPLYDGATGQIVWYIRGGPKKTWVDWNPGHLQERLPRAVYTLCPDFPTAEELGVEINEAQTAVTYDKLIEQDPGRRVLRPDLITIDPTEVIE